MSAPTSPIPARRVALMRAWAQHEYGSPDVLGEAALPVPVPEAGQVRVQVVRPKAPGRPRLHGARGGGHDRLRRPLPDHEGMDAS